MPEILYALCQGFVPLVIRTRFMWSWLTTTNWQPCICSDGLPCSDHLHAGPPPTDSLTSPSTSLRRPTSWQSRRRSQLPLQLQTSPLMHHQQLGQLQSTGSQPATQLRSRTRGRVVSCPCNYRIISDDLMYDFLDLSWYCHSPPTQDHAGPSPPPKSSSLCT